MATKISQQIIDDQRTEIEALKAQWILDNRDRANKATEIKNLQTKEAKQLREDLRTEMKTMMEQFMLSLSTSMTGDRQSKRAPNDRLDETNDNNPSEK